MSTAKIALAAGGTGGHMFPALSLARALAARGAVPVLFTDARGAALPADLARIETHRVRAGGVASGSALKRLRGAAELAFGVFEARGAMRRLAPAAAVGFGGYVSVPPLLAAARAGVPTLVHEQNAVLGRANRLLARRVDRIACSFERVAAIREADQAKCVHTGNPVRAEIAQLLAEPYAPPGEAIHLLVFGGSQGAAIFSRVVPEAMARLPSAIKSRLRVAQQCRPEHVETVAAAYRAYAIQAETRAFFDDMPRRLAWSHLVVARAGASTTAELACAGRPAILIPYAAAVDDHQTANARALVDAGGAWLLTEREATPERLADELARRLTDASALEAAAVRVRALARPRAAEALADAVFALIGPRAKEAA